MGKRAWAVRCPECGGRLFPAVGPDGEPILVCEFPDECGYHRLRPVHVRMVRAEA